jgi:hypothetical protein
VKEKQLWNAAKPYRIYGVVCAAVGTVLGTGVLGMVFIRAVMLAH